MDSVLVIGSSHHHITSNTTGRNPCRSNCSKKNHYASSYAPKASQHRRKIQKEYNFLRFQQPSLKPLFKSIEGNSTHQQCNKKYVVTATSESSFESDPRADGPKNILNSIKNFLNAISTFCSCYPYGLIGLVLSTISGSLLAVEKLSDISPLFFIGVLQAMIPNLLMMLYKNGFNQLYDIEIDKINKPYLPLAAGKVTVANAITIVACCSILSFWQAWAIGSWPLILGLISIFVIWTAYSIDAPLLRWKKYPILATMVILATWAFIYPLAFFFHMQTFVFKRPAVFPIPLIFNTVLLSFFSITIALFKDIPDIEGDEAFGIKSLSTRLGQKKVFWICISILEMACGVGLLAGATSFFLWSKIVTGLGHIVLASVVLYRARSVDLKSKASIMSFYMFIWKLMYVENLLMPLVR